MSAHPVLETMIAVDPVNGYVLMQYGAWDIWQPGLWQKITVRPFATVTIDWLLVNYPQFNPKDPSIRQGSYDAKRATWTFPPATLEETASGWPIQV